MVTTCLPGETFGELTVVREGRRARGKHRWVWCVCSCGTEREIRTNSLRKGTRSCGKHSCSGVEKRKYIDDELSCVNRLFTNYRSLASRKNREFLLSFEEFHSLIVCNCYYCGKEP